MKQPLSSLRPWTVAALLPLWLLPIGGANAAGLPASGVRDKTMVAWVAPANLTQRGGSALTLENADGAFDALVLGEIAPGKWMAGSEMFHRTSQQQQSWPVETANAASTVQIAIVYHAKSVSIYRDGALYAAYTNENQTAERFTKDAMVLMGLRHTAAAPENRFFTGTIDDARIYDTALSAAQIAALKPNQPSDPKPLAWWDFDNGAVADKMGTFPASTLLGGARVQDGRLRLDTPGALLIASKDTLEAGALTPGSGRSADSNARALREKLLSDPHRAGYHFVTPEGQAMPFDPNGAVFWKGRYHLFYIYQEKGDHNWGHVSSTDLFHWRYHPTGLISGMFSGNCFINKDGRPTMCYHQVGQGNALAVAVDDDLNEWKKLDSNPITPKTKPGDPFHDKYRSWDPYGWVEDGNYYAIFGGEHPAIAKAPTMAGEWRYVGDLMANSVPGVSITEDVSCADFFTLGDKRMLLCISHRLGCRYYLGEWKNEQFHPTFHEKMSWVDNSFFAPESLLDDRGRRIMWAWIFDNPGFKMRTDFGWSGTMSLPRVLSLAPDGTLQMNPPAEIEQLRYHPRKLANVAVGADKETTLDGMSGNSIELRLKIDPKTSRQCGVKICCSPGGEEQTSVYYDSAEGRLKIDTTKSSLTEGAKAVEAGPFTLKPGELLDLRVFVDKSVVEVFANGRQAVMRRVYPSRPDSVAVRFFANGGPAEASSVEGYDMSPSNPF